MRILMRVVLAMHFGYVSGVTLPVEWKHQLQITPTYHYPYKDLEAHLKRQGKTTIPIFTFGSLLDSHSASRTFSKKSLSTGVLTVAIGTKRVFNRDIPIDPSHNWGVPCNSEARAMLNLQKTNDTNDVTNGLLLQVQTEDIEPMRRREYGYDLVPVIVISWDDYLNKKSPHYSIAYTFHSPENTRFTNNQILPRPGYYELTRNAALQKGPEFYHMWLKSTYLSDGKTPITVWEHHVQKEELQTQIDLNGCKSR